MFEIVQVEVTAQVLTHGNEEPCKEKSDCNGEEKSAIFQCPSNSCSKR